MKDNTLEILYKDLRQVYESRDKANDYEGFIDEIEELFHAANSFINNLNKQKLTDTEAKISEGSALYRLCEIEKFLNSK